MMPDTLAPTMFTVSTESSPRERNQAEDRRKQLGARLRELIDGSRFDGNVSQVAAECAGIDPKDGDAAHWRRQLYQFMSGERTPGAKTAPVLARVLDVSEGALRLPPGSRRRAPAPNERIDVIEQTLLGLRETLSRQDERTERLESQLAAAQADLSERLERLSVRLQEILSSQEPRSG